MGRTGPSRAHVSEADRLGDRLEVAVRALILAGVPIDRDIVIRAAGAELHAKPETVRAYIGVLADRERGR